MPFELKAMICAVFALALFPILALSGTSVLSLDHEKGAPAAETSVLYKINAMFGREDMIKRPIDFIPDTPEGWIRATNYEARDPGLMEQLRDAWPRAIAGETYVFDQNQCFELLNNAVPVRGASEPHGFYMHPDKSCIILTIRFVDPMGAPDEPMSWQQGLRDMSDRRLAEGQYLQPVTIDGLPAFNRTSFAVQPSPHRPFKPASDELTAFRLTVGLTHRSVVEIRGLAPPWVVSGMVSQIDRDGLVKRLK